MDTVRGILTTGVIGKTVARMLTDNGSTIFHMGNAAVSDSHFR